MTHMQLGVALMGYGLIGVFSVLLLFILLIKLLTTIFPHKKETPEDSI